MTNSRKRHTPEQLVRKLGQADRCSPRTTPFVWVDEEWRTLDLAAHGTGPMRLIGNAGESRRAGDFSM